MGDAAGHSTQGSLEIPLGIFTGIESSGDNRDTLLNLTEEAVRRKLLTRARRRGREREREHLVRPPERFSSSGP